MTRIIFSHEFYPDEPVVYEALDPKNTEKVSPGRWEPPAGREIIGRSDFLVELREKNVRQTWRLFDDKAAHAAFYESYLRCNHINHELANFLQESHRTPQQIQLEIQRLNQSIENHSDNEPFNPERVISLQALKHALYASGEEALDGSERHFNDLIHSSELELWMVARKNGSNKDAIAMQLKGAAVIDFGGGKAVRPLFADKSDKIGLLPGGYRADPQLHTPVSVRPDRL